MAAVLVYDVGPWEAEQENLTDLIFLQVEGNLSKCWINTRQSDSTKKLHSSWPGGKINFFIRMLFHLKMA